MIRAYRELLSIHRAALIRWSSTALLAGQVFLADLDFDTIGLTRSGGVDLVKWVVLFPFLLLPPLVLPVVSRSLPRALMRSPQVWMTLWLTWSIATVYWSLSPRQTVLQGVGIAGLWLTAVWFVTVFGWLRFAMVTVASATAFLAFGLFADLTAGNLSLAGEDRFTGITYGPTNLARYGTITLILAATLWGRGRQARRLAMVALPLSTIVLLGTNTRTVLAAVPIALLVVLGRRRGWRAALAAATVGFALVMAFISLGGASPETLSRTDDPTDFGTWNGRTTIWPIALNYIELSPMVGYGTGSGEDLWVEAAKEGQIWWFPYTSHNMFLDLALANGIPGLALFVAGLAAFFRRWRMQDTPWLDALVVAILIGGVTEAVVDQPSLSVIALAAAFAQRSLTPDELDERAESTPHATVAH